jgi:D-alanyl-D-alanine carboxypeptidase (penicillin-binding protein 5/6)
MNDHFSKFAFLVAVIGAVLFSRMAYPAESQGSLAKVTSTNMRNAEVPLFVPPSVSAFSAPVVEQSTSTPSSNAEPKLSLAGWVVGDLTNGKVLASLNPDKRWPTASITKLMTAVLAKEKIDLNAKITITENMLAVDPTEQALALGNTYTAPDLLAVMLLPSSNVAAEALANAYGYGALLTEMNSRATAWGMTNTYFGDPSGLAAANQSTASDLFKFAQVINASYPDIFRITRTREAAITEQNSGRKTIVKNINVFAGAPDFIGGKTGHTDEAAGNLLSVFSANNHRIFIVVLGTNDRFGDTRKLYEWYKGKIK